MISWEVLFGQIASVVAVIALGWLLNRLHILTDDIIKPICRLVLDFALPALVLTRMILHVPTDLLIASWYLPVLGAGMVAFSQFIAHFAVRLAGDAHRATMEFCATFPNWFYLALAVLEPIFGADATRILLLLNVGIHAWVWTVGLVPFGQGVPLWKRVGRSFISPPFIATALGVLAVLYAPGLAPLAKTASGEVARLPWHEQAFVVLWQALDMVAAITIPLSLLTVGAQLATATFTGHGGLWGTVWGVMLRLGIIPALTLGVMAAAWGLGWRPTMPFFMVVFLTAAMPTAVVAGQVTELYDGDSALAGRLTFLTTLLSLASVPLWSIGASRLWVWMQ